MIRVVEDIQIATARDIAKLYKSGKLYDISRSGLELHGGERRKIVDFLKSQDGTRYSYDEESDTDMFDTRLGHIDIDDNYIYTY